MRAVTFILNFFYKNVIFYLNDKKYHGFEIPVSLIFVGKAVKKP